MKTTVKHYISKKKAMVNSIKIGYSLVLILFLVSWSTRLASQEAGQSITKDIYVQAGYFKNNAVIPISGFQSFNIGYRKQKRHNRYHGVELTYKRGALNKIKQVPIMQMPIAELLIGGDMKYNKLNISYFRQYIYRPGKQIELGMFLAPGIYYESLVTDPNPYGHRLEDKTVGIGLDLNPCMYIHFDKFSLLLDFNFIRVETGAAQSTTDDPDNMFPNTGPFFDFDMTILNFHHIQVGVAMKI